MEFLNSLQEQQEQIEKQKQLQEQLMEQDATGGNYCSICGTEFARKHHLKRHMMLHTFIKPYVCRAAQCKKSFARKDYLDMHEKTCPHLFEESTPVVKVAHGSTQDFVKVGNNRKRATNSKTSKAKRGKNSNSNTAGMNSSGLKKSKGKNGASAKRRNNGEIFACPHCRSQDGQGKLTFTTKGALTRHNNEKHAQKHYECDICRKSFARKYRLKTHYISHHSIHLSASDLKLKAVSNTSYGQPAMNAYLKTNGTNSMLSSDSPASMLQRAYKSSPSASFFKKRKGDVANYDQHFAKRAKKKTNEIDDVQAAWDLLGMMHCM